METLPKELPSLPDLRVYLRHIGWQESPPGIAGSFWAKGGVRVGVPHDEEDDPDVVASVIQRIAMVERVPVREVADHVIYYWFDVTQLRAANDYRIISTIPLGAAATITSSARIMFRAAGTTSQRERGEIAGNCRQVAQCEIMNGKSHKY
ncbi:hypothetical protein [Asanoa iriomotensis]|nr:hypothetical protein [Asanoa iriomotensis]